MSTATAEESRVRISLSSTSRSNKGEVAFQGLTNEEVEKIRGMLAAGSHWISMENGRLVFHDRLVPLPGPAEDEKMMPFWHRGEPRSIQLEDIVFDEARAQYEHGFPSILLQGICAFGYTPENYRKECEKLESWGFECLRSRRRLDSRFSEVWILHGTFAAKGDLDEAIGPLAGQAAVEVAVRFLQKKAWFGACDVVVRRLAMPNPD